MSRRYYRDVSWLDDYELSERILGCIAFSDFNSVEEIANAPDHELLRMQNFGRISLRELREVIPHVSQRPARRKAELIDRLADLRADMNRVLDMLLDLVEKQQP